MAKWKAAVNIAEAWNRAEEDEITVGQLCAEMLPAFKACPIPLDEDPLLGLEELASHPEEDDREGFDELWGLVYDWGDRERVWIDTIRPRKAQRGEG